MSADDARSTVAKLLGAKVRCTLEDGRVVDGTLLCVDRLKNMILADCIETRTIYSSDYYEQTTHVKRTAQRTLSQAMVPGSHLVKVQVRRDDYEKRVDM